MNINPFSTTAPHYDSYEDFYKFFEAYPEEDRDSLDLVFPRVKPPRLAEQEGTTQIQEEKQKKPQ